MNKKFILEIKNVYNNVIDNNSYEELSFLKRYSKSKIFVSKKTGIVFSRPSPNLKETVSIWTDKIFAKKMDPKKLKYSAQSPIVKARHYYTAQFINDFIGKKKSLRYCDYATGDGNFVLELLRINKNINYSFTEHSPFLYKQAKKTIENKIRKKIYSHNGDIQSSSKNVHFKNFDVAFLNWTLRTLYKPIHDLEIIHSSLKKNGYLVISESSRILVPFKKTLDNYFVKNYETNDSHPWHFSINSLSNLLEICGFRIVKTNRFYDQNDLVVIAQKKDKTNHKPKIKIDNKNDIKKFFIAWDHHSKLIKKLNRWY